MSIHLEEYQDLMDAFGDEHHELLEATFREASHVMSPAGLEEYLEGARALKEKLDIARADLEIAKREGNLAKAGELSYGVIPQLERDLSQAEALEGEQMVEEAVRPEQIAEVVER